MSYSIKKLCLHQNFILLKNTFKVAFYSICSHQKFYTVSYLKLDFKLKIDPKVCTLKNLRKFLKKQGVNPEKQIVVLRQTLYKIFLILKYMEKFYKTVCYCSSLAQFIVYVSTTGFQSCNHATLRVFKKSFLLRSNLKKLEQIKIKQKDRLL